MNQPFVIRFVAIFTALVSGISTFLLLLSFISSDVTRKQTQVADQLIKIVEAIAKEGGLVMADLNRHANEKCSTEGMMRLQRALFTAKYLSDVGYINDQGVVECSGVLGFEKQPKLRGSASFTTPKSFDIWIDQPVYYFGDLHTFAIVRLGRYQGAIDVGAFYEINSAPFHWQTVFVDANDVVAHVAGEANTVLGSETMELAGFSAHYVKRCSNNVPYCAAVRIGTGELLLYYQVFVSFTLVLSLVIAFLSGYLVYSRLKNIRRTANRIKNGLKHQSFYPVYQPLVELDTGKVIGCEVLARFHDKYGSLYPDQFIDEIEQQELTWPFTLNMVNKALSELDKCENLPAAFKVSINIFPSDIPEAYMLDLLNLPVVKQSRYLLALEITENQKLEEAAAKGNISSLVENGIKISIDDFGTGYSNLRQLDEIECQLLKIDRSFVFEMETGALRSSLIPQIVLLANQFGLKVVAEGIENIEQAEFLTEMGVDYGQGWLYGKPGSAVELEQKYLKLKELAKN